MPNWRKVEGQRGVRGVEVAVVERAVRAGHNSMTSVDTRRAGCLGSTPSHREASVFRCTQLVTNQSSDAYRCGSTCPFPPLKRDEGGIAREVEQAQ